MPGRKHYKIGTSRTGAMEEYLCDDTFAENMTAELD